MKQASIRAAVLAAAILLSTGVAAGFGYMPGTTARTAAPGDTVAFTVYIAGTPVTASATAPAGWDAAATPATVTQDTTPTRTVRHGGGYVTVRPVSVSVTVPDDATDGAYRAALRLRQTVDGAGDETALNLAQVQTVPFTVTVDGDYTAPKQDTTTTQQTQETEASGGGGAGGGGGIGGALSSIGNALGMEDDTTTDTADDGENRTDDTETRQPIGGTDETTEGDDDTTEDQTLPADTGTGLLAGGLSSPAFLLFELLWLAVIGYVLVRRYR